MYSVWYIQNFRDPNQASIRRYLEYPTRDSAMARYYTELAQVGVDPTVLKSVVAMVYNDEGQILAYSKETSSWQEEVVNNEANEEA